MIFSVFAELAPLRLKRASYFVWVVGSSPSLGIPRALESVEQASLLVQKKSWSTTNNGQNNLLVNDSFGSNKFVVNKIIGQPFFKQTDCWSTMLLVNKICGQQKCFYQQMFGQPFFD